MTNTFSEDAVAKSIADAKADYARQERTRWRYAFAGTALQGLLYQAFSAGDAKGYYARHAVLLADALIAELEKDGSDTKP